MKPLLAAMLVLCGCARPQKVEVKAEPAVENGASGCVRFTDNGPIPIPCDWKPPAPRPANKGKRETWQEQCRKSKDKAGCGTVTSTWSPGEAEFLAQHSGTVTTSGTITACQQGVLRDSTVLSYQPYEGYQEICDDGKWVPIRAGGGPLVSGTGTVRADQTMLKALDADVPPKEWDERQCVRSWEGIAPTVEDHCPEWSVVKIIHHAECEDKTRFLLKSEDGKQHCLRLPQ